MNPKREVYLLRIQYEKGFKISLREVGGEQSHSFESLEALLHYLKREKQKVPSEDDKGGKT
jgi:hypothetical protein